MARRLNHAQGEPTLPDRRPHDPYAALRFRDFRYYAAGSIVGVLGWQMLNVAVGWELYLRTNSATALGLVGFVQVIPVLLLSLPAGHAIDQYDRRKILMLSQLVLAASGVVLGLASLYSSLIPASGALHELNAACAALASRLGERNFNFDDPYIPVMFAVLLVNGAARALNQPARGAFLPQLVPPAAFANVVTWNSSLFEICSMAGPAIGGLMIALFLGASANVATWAFASVYFVNAACQMGQFACLIPIRVVSPPRPKEPATLQSLLAGVHYVLRTEIILATLTLDLFAVILGGAVALLPVYAKDILHVGPAGLGWLRAAPSIGAFAMATMIAHLPPMKHAGRNMLLGVAGFGAATVVFGYSTSFWLSMAMLALTGAFDNVSVVIRHTLVQILTPDEMRGRVSAVNGIFIGSSNQLGSLESGLAAAVMGTVPSVVLGGAATVLVVIAAAFIWPQLRRFGELRAAH